MFIVLCPQPCGTKERVDRSDYCANAVLKKYVTFTCKHAWPNDSIVNFLCSNVMERDDGFCFSIKFCHHIEEPEGNLVKIGNLGLRRTYFSLWLYTDFLVRTKRLYRLPTEIILYIIEILEHTDLQKLIQLYIFWILSFFLLRCYNPRFSFGQYSSVGIATRLRAGRSDSRVRFPAEAGNFSLRRIQNGSGAHTASYLIGTRGSFLGVKRPEHEADHSPSYSAEVKEWMELYLPSQIQLHGLVLS
jgi:hypothetical protein